MVNHLYFVMHALTVVFLSLFYLCNTEEVSVKLVGLGTELGEGNVFVKRGSDWGVVCDDDWDIEDGNVVCRQLGFGRALRVTEYNKYHSAITEKVFLDDVMCQGHENNLGECKHREWLTSNCNAGEAAGVVCDTTAAPAHLKISASFELPSSSRPQVQLLDERAASASSIDLETESNPIDLDRSAGQMSMGETEQNRVIAEEENGDSVPAAYRGYSLRTRELLARVQHLLSPDFSQRNVLNTPLEEPVYQPMDILSSRDTDTPYYMGDIRAPGDQLSGEGQAALIGVSGSFSVNEDQLSAVVPREVSDDEIIKIDQVLEEMKSDEPLGPPARPYRVEIVGGKRSNEGYVRITMDDGKRGSICSDNWGIFEAMVVCRQAGKQHAEKATVRDYYGASGEDKVIYEVNCDGHERSLRDCEYRLSDRHGVKCSKPMNVAGVICTSAKLPDLMPNIWALMSSLRIEQAPLHSLTCAMEENCLSSSAYRAAPSFGSYGYNGLLGGFSSGPTRKLLRFSSNIFNNGTADFRPRQDRSAWEWHSCHQHYHSMGAFSHYDVLDSHGNRVAEGHKASFCLEDVECNWGHTKKYSCRGFADQGISVGCADVYKSDIDCQWIDITDLQPGAFVFKLNVNPEREVPELSFDNNAAVCELTYNGYSAKLSDCVLARG
ncbi:lysyl oxidase homolog 3A-like [Watersipora subatra]|uniref:lysyl oxidase homolog 3A-like n=1 Tax=Watersipora subatra TaxID=2589382 RepID=UPI00355C3B81